MPHNTQRATGSCLLHALRRHISAARLDLAVDTLPLLFRRGLRPDSATLSLLLRECLRAAALPLARRLHLFLRLSGLLPLCSRSTPFANHLIAFHFLRGRPSDALRLFEGMPSPNLFSFNAMLAGYARLGLLRPARRLFDRMPHRDLVSFNTMILALARSGDPSDAVALYCGLRRNFPSLGVNAHTFSPLLLACVRLANLELTRLVHAQVLVVGVLPNLILSSSLVDAYCKCGCVSDANRLFEEMPMKDVLAWTTLVYGYTKSGDLDSAQRLFDEMPEKNSVSWTALISGYTRCGYPLKAMNLFRDMMVAGFQPDQFTFSSSLCASAAVASLKHGKQIHARLLRTHFAPNAIVLSSLVDMYSKCGDLAAGQWIFNLSDINRRDSILWNTIMSAVGQHGDGKEVIRKFKEMVSSGIKPDSNTFVVLLTACSHSGLVEEGIQYFESMRRSHGIIPGEDHFVCLVDLLGRAGQFELLIGYLNKLPCKFFAQAWNSFLGACRIHGNLQLGRVVAQKVIKMDPQCSSAYILLSNFYAEVGRWESVEKVRHLMEDKNVRKERASSWIQVDNGAHSPGHQISGAL